MINRTLDGTRVYQIIRDWSHGKDPMLADRISFFFVWCGSDYQVYACKGKLSRKFSRDSYSSYVYHDRERDFHVSAVGGCVAIDDEDNELTDLVLQGQSLTLFLCDHNVLTSLGSYPSYEKLLTAYSRGSSSPTHDSNSTVRVLDHSYLF